MPLAAWLVPGLAASLLPQQGVLTNGGHLGAVASESIECSKLGRDILAKGVGDFFSTPELNADSSISQGNAVDAMVSTQLCVGVIGMYHSGIGGGGFAVVRGEDGEYESVDFRESAPAAASENMFKDHVRDSIFGGLATGVPSELKGLDYLHRKYGVSATIPAVFHC